MPKTTRTTMSDYDDDNDSENNDGEDDNDSDDSEGYGKDNNGDFEGDNGAAIYN